MMDNFFLNYVTHHSSYQSVFVHIATLFFDFCHSEILSLYRF